MRPTRAIIDLDQLAANYHASRQFIGENLAYMAVVKADAYGHGAVRCAHRLQREGIDWFGVALVEEGVELRQAGITGPILVLGSLRAGDEPTLVEYDLVPAIFDLQTAAAFSRSLGGRSHDVHVKIDTGMGRLGVRYDALEPFLRGLGDYTNLRVTGAMTHFAMADDPARNDLTDVQIERFKRSLEEMSILGFSPKIIDVANSPGAIGHESARTGLVRLGGALYGLLDDMLAPAIPRPSLGPVMSLVSRIGGLKVIPPGEGVGYGHTSVTKRETTAALIPIGYADGYSRQLSNKASVIIRNRVAPVIGRISMDWTIVDVTEVPSVAVNDSVVLIGSSQDATVTAADLAGTIGTISYEVTCGISSRVPRRYIGAGNG